MNSRQERGQRPGNSRPCGCASARAATDERVGLDRAELREIERSRSPQPTRSSSTQWPRSIGRDRDEQGLRRDGIRPIEIECDAGRFAVGRNGFRPVVDQQTRLRDPPPMTDSIRQRRATATPPPGRRRRTSRQSMACRRGTAVARRGVGDGPADPARDGPGPGPIRELAAHPSDGMQPCVERVRIADHRRGERLLRPRPPALDPKRKSGTIDEGRRRAVHARASQ